MFGRPIRSSIGTSAGALFLFACMLVLSIVGARPAHAVSTYCVSTNAQLATALNNARYSATTIKIVQGHYDLVNTTWHRGAFVNHVIIAGGSSLLGGYTANCADRNIEVNNTIMDDSAQDSTNGGPIGGDLTIEGLTWVSRSGLTLNADAGDGDPVVPAGSKILLRRDAFLHIAGNVLSIYWGQDDDVGGTIRIVDSLIASNTSVNCSLNLEINSGQPNIQLVNNTVFGNTGAGGSLGSGACITPVGNAFVSAYNNIFHDNAVRDFSSGALAGAPFVDNTIGAHNTPGALESGTLSGDPKLDSNYRPIESPISPVINTGSSTAPGGLPSTDLPGRARVIGSAPDRGAFESSIDDSFVQTVTNTNDSGVGSLRSAISGAVAHGSGLIKFDIGSSCGPHVIALDSPLPNITVPMIINGATQTGSTLNDLDYGDDATLCVILESNDPSVTIGLHVPSTVPDNMDVHIYGLAYSGFSDEAIDLQGGSGHSITGSRFGGSVGGRALQANNINLRLGTNTHDVTIGGDDPADRNIIGGATGSGIALFGSGSPSAPTGTHHNQIVGNLIGLGWNIADAHPTDLGNGARGVYISGHDNTVSGNFIGSNATAGVILTGGAAYNNSVDENFIGYADALASRGNGGCGVQVAGAAGDAPGTNNVLRNVISYNGAAGVCVQIGRGNTVQRNGIYANTGLGIDLDVAGVMANDNDAAVPSADFANRGLNYPELSSAAGGTMSGTFSGTLSSTIGSYRIDFYDNPGGCAAGRRDATGWIGSTMVTISIAQIGGNGVASFQVPLGPGDLGSLPNGAGITATATDLVGNTSELSACIPYANDTIFADGFDVSH